MDCLRFEQACAKAMGRSGGPAAGGIGTLGEKCLHAALKLYFQPDESRHEVKIGSFVADAADESGIIEIQTRQFSRLRKKLEAFLPLGPVNVVFPVAHIKHLFWIDPRTGETGKGRKSPKTGTPYEIFPELYRIKPFLNHPNLRFTILLINLDELRYLDGWSTDGKKGSTRCDRIPRGLAAEVIIGPGSYGGLVPPGLPEFFTAKDFQVASRLSLGKARTALNVLRFVGAVKPDGKDGRQNRYRILSQTYDKDPYTSPVPEFVG